MAFNTHNVLIKFHLFLSLTLTLFHFESAQLLGSFDVTPLVSMADFRAQHSAQAPHTHL